MAEIKRRRKTPPSEINAFLGLREESTGDTGLQLGESGDMVNFRITENYKLDKRDGYTKLFDSITSSRIDGMFYGNIQGSASALFSCNGNVYDLDYSSATASYSIVGTISQNTTSFYGFNDDVYILDGTDYYKYDGSTFATVSGYAPIVTIATAPTGGGTTFEGVNVLTGSKVQQYNCDGTSSVYQLLETAIDTVDYAKLDGTTISAGSYTVNTTSGQVTFNTTSITGWASGEDNVEIKYTKGTGSRQVVTNNLYHVLYGGKTDTRVHLFGSSDNRNRIVYSSLANGVPSVEYFPATNYNDIGSENTAITDIVKQYDRMVILKENDTHYSYYNSSTDSEGNVTVTFPVFTLNQKIGNTPYNQAQIINNNPYSVYNGVMEWLSTTVKDERNAKYISKRVEISLDDADLSTAVTFDYEALGEYWLAIGKNVYIHNYRNDTWYKYTLQDTPTSFMEIDGEIYFGDTNGTIHKFRTSDRSDNGTAINAYWEMNFYDFGAEWLQKYLDRIWVALQPQSRARIDLTWITDVKGDDTAKTAYYNIINFEDVDFEHFSFLTSYNPQPFRFKIKAKKFAYFKLILTNNSDSESATVLSINLRTRTGGEVK